LKRKSKKTKERLESEQTSNTELSNALKLANSKIKENKEFIESLQKSFK